MSFKKFSKSEDVVSSTKIKSSVQRSIRTKLLEQMPLLASPIKAEGTEEGETSILETIWPKKEDMMLVKCREHLTILALNKEPLFFQSFDGPYFPTLRLVQKYPMILPKVQVDTGAIKFVLAGANIMCPGMTSKGGWLPEDLNAEKVVAVHAEGKENPCAIGFTKMSAADMRSLNKNIGVENIHYLGDDLWNLGPSGL